MSVKCTEKKVSTEKTGKEQGLKDGETINLLQKTLELKEDEVDMQQKSNQLMVEENAKDMTRLINCLEKCDKIMSKLKLDMKDLEEQLADMDNKRKEVDENRTKRETKRIKLEKFIDTFSTKANAEAKQLQENIHYIKEKLLNTESANQEVTSDKQEYET